MNVASRNDHSRGGRVAAGVFRRHVVVAVTGHRDLTLATVELVEEALRVELAGVSPLVGLTCLAAGADQVFARVVLDLNGTIEVVVPTRHRDDAANHTVYEALLARASRVRRLGYATSSPAAYMAANASLLAVADRLIAIWDGLPGRGLGGTADAVTHAWRTQSPSDRHLAGGLHPRVPRHPQPRGDPMTTDDPLVLPLARYLGDGFNSRDKTTSYDLRGGWDVVHLTRLERDVWAMAHGIPDQLKNGRRWTRTALRETLQPQWGAHTVDQTIDNLISRDILAEITPGNRERGGIRQGNTDSSTFRWRSATPPNTPGCGASGPPSRSSRCRERSTTSGPGVISTRACGTRAGPGNNERRGRHPARNNE